MKHIMRIDRAGTRFVGWRVRLCNATVDRFFTDKKYGCKDKSMLAAQGFRDSHPEYIKKQKKQLKSAIDRYKIQFEVGRKTFKLGTGEDAADRARELGASYKTISRIKNGHQDFFCCYHRPPLSAYEVFGFKYEITNDFYLKVREMVESRCRGWDELSKSEIVSSVLLSVSATGGYERADRIISMVIKSKSIDKNKKRKTVSIHDESFGGVYE